MADTETDQLTACCCCYLITWSIWAFILYKILDYVIRIPRIRKLQEKYILVTGCDTGFGHEIAKRLDKLGCHVFAGCYSEAGETELRKKCSERLKTIPLDVTKAQSVKDALGVVTKSLPPGKGLWGVLNNAGISGLIGPVEWLTIQDYDDVFNVNLYGVIDVTNTFLPLVKRECGRVVSAASVSGRLALVGSTPYCISKYGLECFSDALRRQLRPYKCSVHLIEPGFHKTNIMTPESLGKNFAYVWNRLSPELKEEFGEEFYQKSSDILINKFIQNMASEKISDVVDAYEHALLGAFPRARYVVGKDAKFFWLPVQWLPEWLGDKLLELAAPEIVLPAMCQKEPAEG